MALVLNQIVRVRVAMVLDTADNSVGQVYDDETAHWTDLVWIDVANSTAMPFEFGNVEFFAEVASLALTRFGVTRPGVRLRAWRSGGDRADEYEILVSGSTTYNQAKLQRGGADLMTTLPGLGAVLNKVRVRTLRDQRVGWTGRVPAALSWDRSTLAIRKRIKYGADSTYEQDYLSGVSGFAGSLGALNTWLAANQPEFGAALTISSTLEFSRPQTQVNWTYRNKYVGVFTAHLNLAFDGSSWLWATRGALIRQTSNELTADVCGGRTGVRLFYGDTIQVSTANAAYLGAGQLSNGTTNGTVTTPAAGGGTVTISPRAGLFSSGTTNCGVDLTLTVTPKGRVTNVSVAGYSSDGTVESVSTWGACKTEGGYLA
ncbi:MAG: hypothetical protein H0X38_00025 [Planctomycetes bacterium]|nr:hypothetical protein [Planctomycetota bacterium]